jgi:acyl-CoA thioester hydrolase
MSPDIAWDLPSPHVLPVLVAEAHIDLMRHVNNVVYLQWLEDVAWDHSVVLGMTPQDYTRLGHGMVVRRHELDYVLPAFLGDRLLLATWIVDMDRLSLHRRYQFVRESDGTTVFRGGTHFVCVEIESGRVRRMPAEFTAVYERGLSRPASGSAPAPGALPQA